MTETKQLAVLSLLQGAYSERYQVYKQVALTLRTQIV